MQARWQALRPQPHPQGDALSDQPWCAGELAGARLLLRSDPPLREILLLACSRRLNSRINLWPLPTDDASTARLAQVTPES